MAKNPVIVKVEIINIKRQGSPGLLECRWLQGGCLNVVNVKLRPHFHYMRQGSE